MRITGNPGCSELHPFVVGYLNILIEKQGGMMSKTMEKCKELVSRCNDCIYGIFCIDNKEANIKFLEENNNG